MKSRAAYFRQRRADNLEDQRAKDRQRYADHRDELQERRNTYTAKQREPGGKIHSFNEWLSELKNGPWIDCGNMFPACAMDWDHVRGDKSFNLSAMRGLCETENLKKCILEEIAKCDLVCACCHRIRTEDRRLAADPD